MRTLFPIYFFLFILAAQSGHAQMFGAIQPERHGVTVSGSETVNIKAKYLRGFLTLKANESTPRLALISLNSKKQTAVELLLNSGLEKSKNKSSGVRVIDLDARPALQASLDPSISTLSTTPRVNGVVAAEHLSFDLPLHGLDEDAVALLPHTIREQLQANEQLQSSLIQMLYVGEVSEAQGREAFGLSIEKAKREAKTVAELAEVSLGKLVAITPQVYGYWEHRNARTSDSQGFTTALELFQRSDNEIMGTDPKNLSRTYSVELRYDIKEAKP
ncbi:MAG: SIMPL domain-containing protein [Pirellulales bacterium]